MRVVSLVVSSAVVLFAIAACSSSTTDDAGSSGSTRPEGGSVDPDYCNTYCDAQASAGTQQGSRADCLAQCCKDVPDGCPTSTNDAGKITDGAVIDAPLPGDSAADGPQDQCTTGADCTSGCCAPATNAAGDPVGPYMCKPNDGKNYDCCSGAFTTCGTGACCGTDDRGNQICTKVCVANTDCGAARCTGFTYSSFNFECKGSLGCGPGL